jgi:hypothetical protein
MSQNNLTVPGTCPIVQLAVKEHSTRQYHSLK